MSVFIYLFKSADVAHNKRYTHATLVSWAEMWQLSISTDKCGLLIIRKKNLLLARLMLHSVLIVFLFLLCHRIAISVLP